MFYKLKRFLLNIIENRKIIFSLAKNDFNSKFVGSYFGMFWAFLNPIVTILVYWFVFEKGLRANKSIGDVPFILWLTSGLIPWFYFSEALLTGTAALISYSYLVKKVLFNIEVLPIVKTISALFFHIIFVIIVVVLFGLFGYPPDKYYLQIPYYIFCSVVMVTGMSYITSSIVIFFRDLNHLLGIILQFGVWVTPIMWSYKILPPKYHMFIKLNPVFYIVEGYRDIFINKVWFWDKQYLSIYFWLFTMIVTIIGYRLFQKLRVHFADVL